MQARRPERGREEIAQHPQSPSRRDFLKAATTSLLLGGMLTGCHELKLRKFWDKEEIMRENVRSAIRGEEGHARLIGDYIKIADSTLSYIKVQGVGFVHRLDGTGEDPPASQLRTMLADDMRRQGVNEPNSLLRSADTCLVVVTAYVPPIVRKGDILDVEVTLPDGSDAKSLAGGWLMPCRLSEHALLGGQVHTGNEIVTATGPILVNSLATDADSSQASLKMGRIPAGGKYTGDDRDLLVGIRNDYRTVRMSTQIASNIGRRFYDYDRNGLQRKLCEAKSNAHLELIVHERYRENYPRYLQVIRHISLSKEPVEMHMRMQQIEEAIMFGPTAEKASLELEAMGTEAVPVLKKGLASQSPEARFRSAEALAYLGNQDGVPVLKEAAANEPAFRIFALAALAAVPNGDSASALKELMNEESLETRYGAFRALSTMYPKEASLNTIEMKGNFKMHLIDSQAEPFIHLTRRKKSEIVLFGAMQEFELPMFVRAGKEILIQGTPSADGIVVKRIAVGEETESELVSTRVSDVIKAASNLGATYADIVQMLIQAKEQNNIVGEIAIDKLPRPGRIYQRKPEDMGGDLAPSAPSPVPIGNDGLMPNLFDEQPNKTLIPGEQFEPVEDGDSSNGPPVGDLQANGSNSFEVL